MTIAQILYHLKTIQLPNGLFTSVRYHANLPYYRTDYNIYFSALIAWQLKQLLPYFSTDEQGLALSIIEKIHALYPKYANQKAGTTVYNFYSLHPKAHYQKSYFLGKIPHFKLPDDADDTAIIYLSLFNVNKAQLLALKKLLTQYANLEFGQAVHLPKDYKHLAAYNVWLGTNAMPVEIDVCVLCNILYFTQYYELPVRKVDEESINFLKKVINSKDYDLYPYQVSHLYPNSSLIVYHITRLLGAFPLLLPANYGTSLVNYIHSLDVTLLQPMEQLLLNLSLKQLGKIPIFSLCLEDFQSSLADFPFLYAPMLSGTTSPLLQSYAKHPFSYLLFRCEAYYWTLWLASKV